MWKQLLSDYLNYTKRERNGILVLLSLIVFFLFLPYLYPYFITQKKYNYQEFEMAIASLEIMEADSAGVFEKRNIKNFYPLSAKDYYKPSTKGELFYFDPNTASTTDWKKLGIRDKTIATIQNYLSRGGKFYKKEDIGKIWGLHKEEVERLLPYVQIKPVGKTVYSLEKEYEKKEYKKPTYASAIVDINSADTAAFIALPGIGSKLSQRIINFRDKLGGFYKVEQIGETFSLPDSTFQKIKISLKIGTTEIRQININTASVDHMKSHPYIRYALANAIAQYRSQHGKYSTVADIKKIMTVTDEVFEKLAPYLAVN